MRKEDRIQELILKHLKEELTLAEQQELQAWIAISDGNRSLFEELTQTETLRSSLQDYHASAIYLENTTHVAKTSNVISLPGAKPSKRYWLAAASIIILISTCAYLIFFTSQHKEPVAAKSTPVENKTILPATQKATLTLADNTTIALDDAQNGTIAEQSGITIKKTGNGALYYDDIATGKQVPTPVTSFNTMTTPRGGYYIVTLADGSKVWLNAASSLKFPTTFTNGSRIVELHGEAYFEIAKVTSPKTKMRVPFLVKAGKGTIEVLGTKFNVNNYSEERSMVTTLLEGSVQVVAPGSSKQEKLTPGQQAVLSNSTSSLSVNDADAESIISWTKGDFYFDKADLQDVMRQLARWYDIDVVYDEPGIVSLQRTFQGAIQRNLPLSEVLPQLERIGNVRLTITGTTVHVNRALK